MSSSVQQVVVKKDRSTFVNKTYLMTMIPLFYQTHLKSQFSPTEYLLLTILINVLQSIKKVSLEALATNLPIPILFESRRKKLQRFLSLLFLTIEKIWFPIVTTWLSTYFQSDKMIYSSFRCYEVQLVLIKSKDNTVMKAYSVDIREKIVAAHIEEKISIRQVALRFAVSKSLVQKLVKQQKSHGNLQPLRPGKPRFSHLTNAELELRELVSENPDATIVEFCELFAAKTGNWVSQTAMCRYLQKLGLNRKKKHCGVAKQQLQEFKNSE